MRRRFVCHPRGYAGDRPVRLRNDDQLSTTVGVLPDNEHGLTAPGMERIVNPPLDRVLAGSMSLLRAAPPPSRGQALDHANVDLLLEQMGGKAGPRLASARPRSSWASYIFGKTGAAHLPRRNTRPAARQSTPQCPWCSRHKWRSRSWSRAGSSHNGNARPSAARSADGDILRFPVHVGLLRDPWLIGYCACRI
jgi:hypothetical protein